MLAPPLNKASRRLWVGGGVECVELRKVFVLRRVRGLELLNFLGWEISQLRISVTNPPPPPFPHRFGANLLVDKRSGYIDSCVKLPYGEILKRPPGL